MYPESIKNLIESFKYLPGIGQKTAERLAFSVLDFEEEQVSLFSDSLLDVHTKIHKCSNCNGFTENDICDICNDESRSKNILCVVDDAKTIFTFEGMNVFKGRYHVLEGLISPIEGVNPEDIGLPRLIERIKSQNFDEIVFAFKPTIEGETTSLYIKKIIGDMSIKITKLASGIPMGVDIEYIDSLTLERALFDRKEIE